MRISETRRASLSLSAIKFNKDEVFTWYILLGGPGDIFAADIMYHKNCLSNYLRKFEREVEMIMNPPLDYAENVEITKILQELSTVRTINIKNHAYTLSACRDSVNKVLNRQRVNGNYFFFNPLRTVTSDSRDFLTSRRYKIRPRKIQNETDFFP